MENRARRNPALQNSSIFPLKQLPSITRGRCSQCPLRTFKSADLCETTPVNVWVCRQDLWTTPRPFSTHCWLWHSKGPEEPRGVHRWEQEREPQWAGRAQPQVWGLGTSSILCVEVVSAVHLPNFPNWKWLEWEAGKSRTIHTTGSLTRAKGKTERTPPEGWVYRLWPVRCFSQECGKSLWSQEQRVIRIWKLWATL